MSVHVCHGDWFKHNVLKVNHLAGLTITTAMGSKLCLAAKRHKNILMYHSLSMAGSTVAFIRYREDKGPSRGINSTCLSERRGLAFLLAVTDCWANDWLANGEHDLVSATHKKVEGKAPKPLLCLVMLHLLLEKIIFIWMWLSHG